MAAAAMTDTVTDTIERLARLFAAPPAPEGLGPGEWYEGVEAMAPEAGSVAEAALQACGAGAPVLSGLRVPTDPDPAAALLKRLQPGGDRHAAFFHADAAGNIAAILQGVSGKGGFPTPLPNTVVQVARRVRAVPAALWLALELKTFAGTGPAGEAADALLSCWGASLPPGSGEREAALTGASDGPGLLARLRAAVPQAIEAWDLCAYLLGVPGAPAARRGTARILGYFPGHAAGFAGTLTVEWVEAAPPAPAGLASADPASARAPDVTWVRHPNALLLPTDAGFDGPNGALQRALDWAMGKYFGGGKDAPRAYLRWQADYDRDQVDAGHHLPCATGGSVGLAAALCLAQIWGGLAAEPTLAVSGVIAPGEGAAEGRLAPVYHERQKRAAAKDAPEPVYRVLFPRVTEGADALPTGGDDFVARVATVDEAVAYFVEQGKPLRDWRRRVEEDCGRIDLIDHTYADGMDPRNGVYIDVSLLMEVEEAVIRSQMSRSRGGGRPGEDGDKDDGVRMEDFMRADEELMASLLKYRVGWDRGNPRAIEKCFPLSDGRIAVLGPPGSGKTTLLRYLAWHAARHEDTFVRAAVTRQRLTPAFVSLRQWKKDVPLAQYLAGLYQPRDGETLPDAAQWERWLKDGSVLLLIDGLDEIDQSTADWIKDSLTPDLCAGPVVFSCRTLQRDMLEKVQFTPRARAGGQSGNVFTPQPLTPEQQRAYVARYFRKTGKFPTFSEADAERIVRDAQRIDPLLVSTPLFLDIVCYVRETDGDRPSPRTRTGLYDRAVDAQVTKLASVPVGAGAAERRSDASEETLRAHLEDLAWGLTDAAGVPLPDSDDLTPRIVFPRKAVADRLLGICRGDRKERDAILADFTRHLRLLPGNVRAEGAHSVTTSYTFLHRNFQAFLVASYLARRCAEKGWDAAVSDDDHARRRVWEVVDRNCWLPTWEDTLIFAAGLLKLRGQEKPALVSPGGPLVKMLQLLADEKRDDIMRHRLALAALMLPEVVDRRPEPPEPDPDPSGTDGEESTGAS